jgi:hypothetical protein
VQTMGDRFNHDKFGASNKHKLHVSVGKTMGGVPIADDLMLVSCDIDRQPHYLDAHTSSQDGAQIKCMDPYEWTTKGIAGSCVLDGWRTDGGE